MKSRVGIVKVKESGYPDISPFHPEEIYPEYPWDKRFKSKKNHIYSGIRELLKNRGYDFENFGKKNWNPLGDIIKPGEKVVLKPNFVIHFNSDGHGIDSVVTHGSVIRAILDYVYIALNGRGEIVVCDSPQFNCNFNELIKLNKIDSVSAFYENMTKCSKISFNLIDLRKEWVKYGYGCVWEREKLSSDPLGDRIVTLKNSESNFEGIDNSSLYGADYNRTETMRAHRSDNHSYCVSGTVLSADVVISLPKLKVHRKTGITVNIKNFVGMNINKNYLIHYRVGKDGDEFSNPGIINRIDRKFKDLFLSNNRWSWGKYFYSVWHYNRKAILKLFPSLSTTETGGDWYGNDTTWRMALDLIKILLFSDKNGNFREKKERKFLSIVDGITGGEGEGPLRPNPYDSKILMIGEEAAAVDIIASLIMGLDPSKIKLLTNIFEDKNIKITEMKNIEDFEIYGDEEIKTKINNEGYYYRFNVPSGWKNHIEKQL